MKWKGTVSQLGKRVIATRFAAANANQAASTDLCRSQPIAAMSHRLDRRVRAELLPQSPDADVDDVRAGVEVVAPDLREQPLAADDLALVAREMVQQPELAVGELRRDVAEAHLPPRDVQRQPSG